MPLRSTSIFRCLSVKEIDAPNSHLAPLDTNRGKENDLLLCKMEKNKELESYYKEHEIASGFDFRIIPH